MRPKSSRRGHDDNQHEEAITHDESNWLVSYADMMTLLFGFFVLMYSFSRVDEDKFEVVRKDLVKYFGGTLKESPGGSNFKKVMDVELSKMMGEGGFTDGQMQVKVNNNRIQMTFSDKFIFSPGSAELTANSARIVDRIAQELKKLPVEDVEIEGHTDADAIKSPVFPSNWELSTARSARIVRRMIENGLDETKMTSLGFASARPAVPHNDANGQPIVENKEKNRRVVLNIRLKPDGNLSVAQVEQMGFKTVKAADIQTEEDEKKVKEILDKTVDVKQKIEEAQKRFRETNEKLKAAKDLEKSLKEMEKITKKTEEIEKQVEILKNQNDLLKRQPAEKK